MSITDTLTSPFSWGKDILIGNENKIAKPISDFSGISFSSPGSTLTTGNGSFNLTRTPQQQAALAGLSGAYSNLSGAYGSLVPLVSPAYGNLTKIGSQAIEDTRRKTVSDLRKNLAQRRVLGSSFASNDISRTNAEFAKQDAQFRAETKLQEIQATAELSQKQYEAAANASNAILTQNNFDSTMAAEISRQYNSTQAELAKFESQLLSDEANAQTALLSDVLHAGLTGAFSGAGGGSAFGNTMSAIDKLYSGVKDTQFGQDLATLFSGTGDVLGIPGGLGGLAGAAGTNFWDTAGGFKSVLSGNPQDFLQSGLLNAGAGAGLGALYAGLTGGDVLGGAAQGAGGATGAALGTAVMPGIGTIVGGVLGASLGGKLASALGISGRGGGEDKPDYSVNTGANANINNMGIYSSGAWGDIGIGWQKHIANPEPFKSAAQAITTTDDALSHLFTPEENAKIKAAMENAGTVARGRNEGGYSAMRMLNQMADSRASILKQVLGSKFDQLNLGQFYTALKTGDEAKINDAFTQIGQA